MLEPSTPSPSTLEQLPPELLHRVVGLLDTPDVKAVRRTCRLLTAIGNEYLLDHVKIYFKRKYFERLPQIAQHPVISKRIRSFYYQPDQFCDPPPFDDWFAKMRYDLRWIDDEVSSEDGRMGRMVEDDLSTMYTQEELKSAYDKFCSLFDDQEKIVDERLDVKGLTELFQNCPKLDEVTVAFRNGTDRTKPELMTSVFKETLTNPWKHQDDAGDFEDGLQPLSAVLEAVHASDKVLRKLTLACYSYLFLTKSKTLDRLRSVIPGLHKFRIGFQEFDDEVQDPDEMEEASGVFQTGILRDLLSLGQNIRVLKFRFPGPAVEEGAAKLSDIVGDLAFPKLREIGLCMVATGEEELYQFLVRHKSTLRYVALSYMTLLSGSWISFFKRMGGQLPKLQFIKLRAEFDGGDSDWSFRFDAAEIRLGDSVLIQDAIERYILFGGDFPDIDALEALIPENGKEDRDEDQLYTHLDEVEYEGYTSDGSIISWNDDLLDRWI